MVKLLLSVLAGYGIFVGLMTFQIITPLIDGIDARLGTGALRVVVPEGAPVPAAMAQFIDDHPQLVLRLCEGSIVVLLSWSTLLLLTHWARNLRTSWHHRRHSRAAAASRHLAASTSKNRDIWK